MGNNGDGNNGNNGDCPLDTFERGRKMLPWIKLLSRVGLLFSAAFWLPACAESSDCRSEMLRLSGYHLPMTSTIVSCEVEDEWSDPAGIFLVASTRLEQDVATLVSRLGLVQELGRPSLGNLENWASWVRLPIDVSEVLVYSGSDDERSISLYMLPASDSFIVHLAYF